MSAQALWIRLGLLSGAAAASFLVDLDSPRSAPWPTIPAVGGGALAGVVLYAALAPARAPAPPRRPPPLASAFLLLWAAVEEALWRRLLLGALAAAGTIPAAAVTTIAFAVSHRHGRAVHLLTGTTFCVAYVATGRLSAAVAAHAAYNLLVAWRPRVGASTVHLEPG